MDASTRIILAAIALLLLAALVLAVGVPTWLGRRERDARRGHRSTVTYVDEAHTMTEADVDELLAVLRNNPARRIIDDLVARASLPNVELPARFTIRNREEAAKRLRELIDSGILHISEPHRLFDPSRYAEGGVVKPKRMCDPDAAEYPVPRTLADALGDDLVPPRRESERYRLDRWTDPTWSGPKRMCDPDGATVDPHDSPSTTPPTEGAQHDDR